MDRPDRRPVTRAPSRPTTPRRRRGVAWVVTSVTALALGSALLPTAAARDLDGQKDKVEERIDEAHEHLDGSSAELQRATDALLGAQRDLARARSRLAKTRGELAAAKALDRKMQAKLEAAVARLQQARRELRAGQADVAEQEEHVRQLVVSAYEQGDPALVGLAAVLTTQDPAEVAATLNANSDVLNVGSTVLDQLKASRVLLQVKEEATEAARNEVAVQRKAAAENVRKKAALERRAAGDEAEVATMVRLRERARSVAQEAKEADLAELARLEKERDRIAALIREQASRTSVPGATAVDGDGFLGAPVAGYVTSPFGWRTHPIWGYRSLHDGVDFGASCGTPVRAAAPGTVLETYAHSAWGNRVILDHGVQKGVGVATISNHLQSFAVSPGQRVKRGQVVGYVGNTGWSTGCHLHYTVLQNGTPVNPMPWF